MNDNSDPFAVKLPDKDSHPVMVGTNFNPAMMRHDLHIVVGNFTTREQAADYGRAVMRFLEDHACGKFTSVQ